MLIDARARRVEGVLSQATVALGAGAPWLVNAWDATAAAAASLLCAAVLVWGFRQCGWLGGRNRIATFSWTNDDHWILTDASGCSFECVLDRATRASPGFVWLRWRVGGPLDATRARRSMLLTSFDAPADDVRRLIVRLHTEARRIAAPGAVAA